MKFQTMELDLYSTKLNYTIPSKIWEIKKIKLEKIPYFKNLFKLDNRNIYLLNDISDCEMKILLSYIDSPKNYNLSNLNIQEIMLLIKLSDFLMIPKLFEIAQQEFFKRI